MKAAASAVVEIQIKQTKPIIVGLRLRFLEIYNTKFHADRSFGIVESHLSFGVALGF